MTVPSRQDVVRVPTDGSCHIGLCSASDYLLLVDSALTSIPKVWGREVIIVNNDAYCGKFLCLNKGAMSSMHYHPIKRETFYCLIGEVLLEMPGVAYCMFPGSAPRTIEPSEQHRFYGMTDAVLLEISTPHDDGDVVRLEPSRSCCE
jgi:quercetin dioxygenase-like cupin family protein